MPITKFTPEIIHAAIDGYEAQKARLDEKIAELRSMLPGRSSATAAAEAPARSAQHKKRRLSAAGRKAIAEAARKRWAAFNAAKKKSGE